MHATTRLYRNIALVSYLLLLVWVILWHTALTDTQPYSALFIFLLYVVPLLLPMHGIFKGKPYTHAWANFITLFYIIHGITVAYAVPSERWFACVEIALSSVMFIGCSMFARFRGRELGLSLPKLKQEMKKEKSRFEKQ
ncbi:DUF2069 domain-containing protein [Salinimonas sp. HHU 13199]|uniref:DUF2069 domain-containing protein n=1 Tax=Salinimonas profundi TaxID=2729140 RepID=A0ABR8LDK5_9ALTE|nr:DUF2069 domain-containing protein [Salinimonas profundi]MBD3584384.1 DUF2069 domain-containing protein [Salinimonas profundi]